MSEDTTAEESVLGAMMLSRDAIEDISELLVGGDFYSPAHEVVFNKILDLHRQGKPADVLTVGNALGSEIGRIGGAAYLHHMAGLVPSPSSGGFYAEIVAEAAIRRRLATAGRQITDMSSKDGDVAELVEAARREVDATSKATGDVVRSFGETMDQMIDALAESPNHVATPWNALNDIIGGLRPGGLYVVAARPSVGKSVAALGLARQLCAYGSVAFSSLEMSRIDVQIRATSHDLHIPLKRLIDRDLLPSDWEKIRKRRESWAKVPLFIDDNAGATITDIKRFARSVNRRQPLAGVFVDYLQLMSQPDDDKRNRQEFVADMTRKLKVMAMDMQVPVIALSQLNRASTQRADQMPMISDLRESGAVEQDADVVILMHREIMGEKRGDLTMLVAKNRNGPTAAAELDFWGHYSEIRDR